MAHLPFLYVANWKMNKSLDQGLDYFRLNKDQLHALTLDKSIEIIVAPTHVSLAPLHSLASKISVRLASQDCSEYEKGPYNGQVDALSLSQVGVCYGIVGHSHPNNGARDSDLVVANKTQSLLDAGVCPLICVGDLTDEYKRGVGKQVVAQQLKPVFDLLTIYSEPLSICIAYEPIWAIGGGESVSKEYIADMIAWLRELTALVPQHNFSLLYGGGVDDENAVSLRSIKELNGFLIGSASLDFQKFEKIVSLTKNDV